MKQSTSFSLTILIVLAFLTSCSSNLDRGDAKKQISECFKTNCNNMGKCTFKVRKTWISDYGSNGGFCSVTFTNPPQGEERNMLNYFFEKKLLQLDREVTYKDCAYWTINTVKMTDLGSKYLVREDNGNFTLLSATFDIDEITGVLQEKDAVEAAVEYKIKRETRTPFGEFWDKNCYDVDRNYKAYFVKYDDGWRMK